METHLDRVDRSLEELTKKVQKHVSYKTPEIINNNHEKQTQNGFQLNVLLKPPYVFIIALPIIFIILLLYFQPSIVQVIDSNDESKKYVSFKKLMIWSIVFSCISGGAIYYFFYMKKKSNNVENIETEK